MSENKDLNKLHSDFISTVSHELRTPLTSIRGFAQTLVSSYDRLDKEQQLKFLNIIQEQSERLINLVENLLAATSGEYHSETYVLKSVSAKKILDKVKLVLKQKYPRKEINIFYSDNVPDMLADEDKVEQLFLNIMENACKYSFENSEVTVRVSTPDYKFLNIAVENDGITIDDENKNKIFEKFSRLDNPMTRLTQGSGMGLYLAKNMADKMNSKILVDSKDNKTVFTIIIPIATMENQTVTKLKTGEKNA